MPAVFINVILVLLGSLLGLLLKDRFSQRLSRALTTALALCTLGIGMSNLLGTRDFLCVVVCMVLGTLLGEWWNIEGWMDRAGVWLKGKLMKKNGEDRFVEGFVSATVLFCVGAMAINGSIQAGLRGDWSILTAKGVMDGVTSIGYAAAMGVGVAFSALPLLIYQGGITLLAGVVGPWLGEAVIGEMSAVGGAIIVGIGVNLLGLGKEKVRVGNMLPAMFLPIAYLPLAQWLGGLLN